MKIKLKITHEIDNNETIIYADGIRENNVITYFDDHMKTDVDIKSDSVYIKIVNNVENHMYFGSKNLGYYIIDDQRLDYKIETKSLNIDKNKVAIEYKIEYSSRYVLEVIDD